MIKQSFYSLELTVHVYLFTKPCIMLLNTISDMYAIKYESARYDLTYHSRCTCELNSTTNDVMFVKNIPGLGDWMRRPMLYKRSNASAEYSIMI